MIRAHIWMPAVAIWGVAAFVVDSWQPQGPTYHRHVAPVIARKCMPCHLPGEVGPFSLRTYSDVAKRAELLRQVLILRKMPLSDAQSDFGRLTLHEKLTDQELVDFQEWVRLGAPEGPTDGPQVSIPNPPKWRMGAPDLVVVAGEGDTVAADGFPYWRSYVVAAPALAGKRIAAFDVRPRAAQAVRQAMLALDREGAGKRRDAGDPFPGYRTVGDVGLPPSDWVGAWAPGYPAWRAPAGSGIAAGSGDLVVQGFYVPTGMREDAGLEVGIYFDRGASGPAPRWIALGGEPFEIGVDEQTTLYDDVTLERDADVLAVVPRARFVARQVRVTARMPNQQPKMLLMVYQWNAYGVGSYVFQKPVRLPKGTLLAAEIEYNNKKHRDAKEDGTTLPVRSGPGLRDEAFSVSIQVIEP